jgi:hypothetical protein
VEIFWHPALNSGQLGPGSQVRFGKIKILGVAPSRQGRKEEKEIRVSSERAGRAKRLIKSLSSFLI